MPNIKKSTVNELIVNYKYKNNVYKTIIDDGNYSILLYLGGTMFY